MISGANIISSADISRAAYLDALREIGNSIGANDLATTERIFDGESNVWIRLIDADEAGYEEEDLKKIEVLLERPAKTYFAIEYDGGETAVPNLLHIVRSIGQRWP